jgi:Na+/H+ antiporter NhaA
MPPTGVSTHLLTFSIVDDVAGIVIIALAYSRHVAVPALAIGLAFLLPVPVTSGRPNARRLPQWA